MSSGPVGSGPVGSETVSPRGRQCSALGARDAMIARNSWASLHWGTLDIHPDAWHHLSVVAADTICDLLETGGPVDRGAWTQAVQDAMVACAASGPHYWGTRDIHEDAWPHLASAAAIAAVREASRPEPPSGNLP